MVFTDNQNLCHPSRQADYDCVKIQQPSSQNDCEQEYEIEYLEHEEETDEDSADESMEREESNDKMDYVMEQKIKRICNQRVLGKGDSLL